MYSLNSSLDSDLLFYKYWCFLLCTIHLYWFIDYLVLACLYQYFLNYMTISTLLSSYMCITFIDNNNFTYFSLCLSPKLIYMEWHFFNISAIVCMYGAATNNLYTLVDFSFAITHIDCHGFIFSNNYRHFFFRYLCFLALTVHLYWIIDYLVPALLHLCRLIRLVLVFCLFLSKFYCHTKEFLTQDLSFWIFSWLKHHAVNFIPEIQKIHGKYLILIIFSYKFSETSFYILFFQHYFVKMNNPIDAIRHFKGISLESGAVDGRMETSDLSNPGIPQQVAEKDIEMRTDDEDSLLRGGDAEETLVGERFFDETSKESSELNSKASQETVMSLPRAPLTDLPVADTKDKNEEQPREKINFSLSCSELLTPKPQSFSSARRNRYKRNTAMSLAGTSVSGTPDARASKRGSDELSPAEQDDLTKRQRSYASVVTEDLKVMVFDGSTDEGDITEEANGTLRHYLNKLIDNTPDDQDRPNFESAGHTDGRPWFLCSNEFSLAWLKSAIYALNKEKKYSLVITKFERKVPLVKVSIPIKHEPYQDPPEKDMVLKRLCGSNKGLNVDLWRIWHVRTKELCRVFVFGIDKDSEEFVRNRDNRLYYGLGRVIVYFNDDDVLQH